MLNFHFLNICDAKSFIKTYNLHRHMLRMESLGLHAMKHRQFVNLVVKHLETLLDAEEWDDKANGAYKELFDYNVQAQANAVLEAAQIGTRRIRVIARLSCTIK